MGSSEVFSLVIHGFLLQCIHTRLNHLNTTYIF